MPLKRKLVQVAATCQLIVNGPWLGERDSVLGNVLLCEVCDPVSWMPMPVKH